jgi:hypothetical protein
MSDRELLRFGRAAREVCKPLRGKPPREVFVIQLEEARAEFKRRKIENANKLKAGKEENTSKT